MRRSEFVDMDPLFEEAAEYAVQNGHVTPQDLQSQFDLGLPRAEIIVGQLEKSGFIGPQEAEIPGETLLSEIDELHGIIGFPEGEEVVEYKYDYEFDAAGKRIGERKEEGKGTKGSKSGNPQYSDSVNVMNGCLGAVGQVFGYTLLILMFIMLAPVVLLLLGVWWLVAWILGLIFPGKEFFPIKKIYNSFAPWFERTFGISLGDAAIASILVVLGAALLDGLSNFFSKKD